MPKVINDIHTEFVWARVDAVVKLIVESPRYLMVKRSKSLTELVMKNYDCSQRTAEKYIKEAKQVVKNYYRKRRDSALERALIDREHIIMKLKAEAGRPDFEMLLKTLMDRDRLLGLYDNVVTHKGTVTIKNFDITKLSDYGLERIKAGEDPEQVMNDPKCLLN